MRIITGAEVDDLIDRANRLPRRRITLRLHDNPDTVQRMVNAILPGSYIAPHKHENPDKIELLQILRGKVAVLRFTSVGDVESIVVLEQGGDNLMVEIPPRVYHSVIAMEPSAMLVIIPGPYDAATHQKFASWSPLEDSHYARDFYLYLESIVHNRAAIRR